MTLKVRGGRFNEDFHKNSCSTDTFWCVWYLPSVGFIIDRFCHIIVMDLVGPLFLNCPLPWATNYPTQFVVGWHSSMDLGPLFQKLPLTLGPPTLHNLLTDL
jgi:hypothetical protein